MNRLVPLAFLALAACDSVLGLHDITPDRDAFALKITGESTGVVNQPLDRITVQAVDVVGDPVVDFQGTITLALGAAPSGAKLLGAATASAAKGVAHFDLVGVDQPGTGVTLVASADGLPPVTSTAIDILAPSFFRVPLGKDGSYIASVAVSPAAGGGRGTPFASAADGVYTSSDGAASWRPAGFGANRPSDTLIADFKQPGTVYMLSSYSALRKTVDNGATWQDIATWRDLATDTSAIAFDRTSSTLYALASGTIRSSSDGGVTWRETGTTGSAESACIRLVADATTAGTLYCQRSDGGQPADYTIYRSSDGGAHWDLANTGLTRTAGIGFLVATPTGVFNARDDGVYRLAAGASTWTRVSTGFGGSLAYAPSNPMRVYLGQGGVAVSTDGGATFAPFVPTNDFIVGLAVDPANANLVYAGGTTSMSVSSNGGTSWARASNGIEALNVISLAMAPDDPSILLAATSVAALRSTNGGATWATPANGQNGIKMFFDPAGGGRAAQCAFNYFATSTDHGASFNGVTPTGLNGCEHLLVHGTTYFAIGGGHIFKSVNGGMTWVQLGDTGSYISDAVLGDADGNVIVAATSTGVYRSTNGGATFSQVTTGYAVALSADPSAPSKIVAGHCAGGVRVSTDGGATFSEATQSDLCVQAMARVGATLYAAAQQGPKLALITSTDGGVSWTKNALAGVPPAVRVSGVAATPDGSAVFVSTTGGLYQRR